MLKTIIISINYWILNHIKQGFAVLAAIMLLSSGLAIYNHSEHWLCYMVISALMILLSMFLKNFDDYKED